MKCRKYEAYAHLQCLCLYTHTSSYDHTIVINKVSGIESSDVKYYNENVTEYYKEI
jgi:hypothetical protein